MGPRKLRTSDGQASGPESFLLRPETPLPIPSALVVDPPIQCKADPTGFQAPYREPLAETHSLRSGARLAEKVVPSQTVTDTQRRARAKALPRRAQELRGRGLTIWEIATALGVSRRTAFRYLAKATRCEKT